MTSSVEKQGSELPVPRWMAQVNKRTFNKLEIKRGKRPVLIHVGRKSGKTYLTPLDAHPIESGYLFVVNYGPGSDWVRNILAAGRAKLRIDGKELEMVAPRLVGKDVADELLAEGTKLPPDFMRITEFLQMEARQ